MKYQDYYKILGVARTASADEIKKAYRRLARKYHPDVSKEANAEAQFKEVQEAYEVLKDPEKRAAYDQLGSQWQSGQQFRPPPGWDTHFGSRRGAGGREDIFENEGFSDFFSTLFGGAFGAGGAGMGNMGGMGGPGMGATMGTRRGMREHPLRLDIDLKEAYQGATRTLELKRQDPNGTVTSHAVRVTIPPGVLEGRLLRLPGQGESYGGRPGDLYLEMHIRPHPLFQLDGKDVTLTLPVAPWEAALGATVKVPTLGGLVEIKVPAGAQSGQKLRLRGRGMPDAAAGAGDQYVQLKVVLPSASSPEARELYEEMRRKLDFDPRADLTEKV